MAVPVVAFLIACALPNFIQGRSFWGNQIQLHHKNPLFGLTTLQQRDILSTPPRGGATKASPQEEPSNKVEEEPAELYLPGLLDAVIVKTDTVRFFLLYYFLLVEILCQSQAH